MPHSQVQVCRMYITQKNEDASLGSGIDARITIPVEAMQTLTSRSFWPRPAHAGPWISKGTSLAKPTDLEETGLQPVTPRTYNNAETANAVEKNESGSNA